STPPGSRTGLLAAFRGGSAGAAADESLAFESCEPRRRPVRPIVRQGDEPGDRPVPIEHEDRATPADVLQIAREIVLQVGYLGLLHMAMLAMLGPWRQKAWNVLGRGSSALPTGLGVGRSGRAGSRSPRGSALRR